MELWICFIHLAMVSLAYSPIMNYAPICLSQIREVLSIPIELANSRVSISDSKSTESEWDAIAMMFQLKRF